MPRTLARCDCCDTRITRKRDLIDFAYWDAFSALDAPADYHTRVCVACSDSGREREGTFYCDACDRDVIDSCAKNGWRGYLTRGPGDRRDEDWCVGCAQRFYLENGLPRADVARGRIAVDFFNYDELAAAGFVEYDTLFASEGSERLRAVCLDAIDSGRRIVADQGATPYGGSPDWVTIFAKGAA